MWAYNSVFYQIYPLGFCGAPRTNDGVAASRIHKIADWTPHLASLGIDAVYLSPLFESDNHGYDTRDFSRVDCRLGSNADFAAVCDTLHQNGIKVVLDGVFNHVGRGFWAFQDVLRNREASPYRDWFYINFGGNSNYNDGLWYEGWEGHFELVKLNLRNPAVVEHLFGCIRGWVQEFGIDGLRLDVAYCLDRDFLRSLRHFCNGLGANFFLVGEMLGGDYNQLLTDDMLHSVTNYECYKGLHSSMNSLNLFEIAHSLLRQSGPEQWALYRGKHLLTFVENHDVTRVASLLKEPAHLPLVYGLLLGMPGIPCLYYGGEWGACGEKHPGNDDDLRPCFASPEENELTAFLHACITARKSSAALCNGSFRNLMIQNKQLIFERCTDGDRVLVAINIDSQPYEAHFDAQAGRARDLLTGETHDFGGGSTLEPYSVHYWQIY